MRKYTLRRRKTLLFVRLLDAVGSFIFSRKRKKDLPVKFERVLVIRLDHIGDIVMAEPFMRELKFYKPEVRITFLTTEAGRALCESLPGVETVVTARSSWFVHSPRFFEWLGDWRRLIGTIRAIPADVIVDLRGDLRHILAARIAKPGAYIVGYGVTGGGFLLDHEPPYEENRHSTERNMAFLRALGVKKDWLRVTLSPYLGAMPLGKEVKELMGPKEGEWIALHAGAGNPLRSWPLAHWKTLARLLSETPCRVFWIGDAVAGEKTRSIMESLTEAAKGRFVDLCSRVPLSQLGTFLKQCDVFVSGDSGPTHLAAAQKVDSVVLFSGNASSAEFAPLARQTRVLEHKVPCAPCRLKVCSQKSHLCMEGITPEIVFGKVEEILEEKRQRMRHKADMLELGVELEDEEEGRQEEEDEGDR